ncbi:glycine C-acetyltransferase [Flavobacteriaceae bacterium UJ101]|nr:glycine C-acetyltransferase [Flavobacteriaceae bacterium UJ101]
MDIFERIRTQKTPLGQYADFGEGYFIFPKLEGEIGPIMKFQGKDVICWSINSYLGLANHPEIRKIDAQAAADWGLAYPMGARPMSGQTKYHEQLEEELASFVQKEASFLLNFGYQGMVSIIGALVNRNDVIVYDMDSHACIIDGVSMHQGKRFVFKHNDIESIEKNLKRAEKVAAENGGGILLISEGVFGMRGNQGCLKEIVELKKKYNFRLLVDDAHGFGVLGEKGIGAGEAQGVQDDIDVYFSTFAKSMASLGAFVAGDKDIIRHLQYNMRSQIFAKSLPMPLVIGGLKRLEMLRTMPELREKLWANVNKLQAGLRENGFDLGTTNSCVTPVYLHGEALEAAPLVRDLREKYGIFTSIVVYPVIPKGMILLRLIPTAVHEFEHIDKTIEAFKAIREKLESGVYARMAEAIAAREGL